MLADESYPNVTAPVLTDITITNNVVIHNESGIRFWDGSFPGQSALKNVHHRQQHRGRQQDDCHQVGRRPAPEHRRGEQHLRRADRVKQALLLQANSLTGVSLDHNLWNLPGVQQPFLWGSTDVRTRRLGERDGAGRG